MSVSQQTLTYHEGPLPPPSSLAEYEAVIEGGAERILAMAERNQTHRQGLDRAAVAHEIRIAYAGQAAALVVALAGIGAGAYIAYLGQTVAGTGVIGGTIVAIVGAYFKGVSSRRREREFKAEIMAGRR